MGSGLGLMLTRQLVQKLGGKLTFESEEGKGTEFTVNIPADIHLDAVARNHSEIIIGDELLQTDHEPVAPEGHTGVLDGDRHGALTAQKECRYLLNVMGVQLGYDHGVV